MLPEWTCRSMQYNNLIDISNRIHVPFDVLIPITEELMKNELIVY